MTFQTFLFPPASCLPDTLPASTNKHPQGLPEYFIYSATSFLFCLYPCLSGLPFSRAPPPSAVRAHHRCSLDPPLLALLRHLFLSSLFFGLSFRTDFSSLPVFTDWTRYRCVPLAVSTFRTFLPPFRCFILDTLEDTEGVSFLWSGAEEGEGKGFSASVSLNCFLFFFFHFDIFDRYFSVMHNLKKNWIE